MQLIYYSIIGIFIIINSRILWSDLRYKKIPNKLLIALLFLGCIFLLLYGNISLFSLGNIFISLLAGFGLYYFGLWSAGDAKYIIILSLFVSNWNFTIIFGNMGLLTLGYLFFYFLYFYGRCLLDWKFFKVIRTNIITDLKDKSLNIIQKSNGKFELRYMLLKTSKILGEFILFFTTIRLIRIYFFEQLEHSNPITESLVSIKDMLLKNPSEAILVSMILSIFLYLFIRQLFRTFKYIIKNILVRSYYKKRFLDDMYLDVYTVGVLCILFFFFILYEYTKYPDSITSKLSIIFTLYISIYLITKIALYIYRISFHISEFNYIPISKLEAGEFIDKVYLYKLFGGEEKDMMLIDKKLSFDVIPIIDKIDNPIQEEDVSALQTLYKNVNTYKNDRKFEGFKEIIYVRTLKTFAFSAYILGGVMITYFYGDRLFKIIVTICIEFIEKYVHIL